MTNRDQDARREAAVHERLVEARFHWEAEVESARRLAQRTGLLITIEGALLGVGAARLGTAPAGTIERILLASGVVAVLIGLLFLLRPKRRHRGRPQASQWLEEGGHRASTPGASSLLRVRVLALERTRNAAVDLGRRNVNKQRDIDRAQLALVLAGVLLTTLGLAALLTGSVR
ncbi:MAG: hypothetical protein HZA53_19545 [Planctomycetes bacterium]|nr:hypothetical protein [Planctomycetota bacterium]